jgi:hypothetical protein
VSSIAHDSLKQFLSALPREGQNFWLPFANYNSEFLNLNINAFENSDFKYLYFKVKL